MSFINYKKCNKEKNRFLKPSLFCIFGLIFSCVAVGCAFENKDTDEAIKADKEFAAKKAKIEEQNHQELAEVYLYATQALIRLDTPNPDSVLFGNDSLSFYSPTYGAVTCGDFKAKNSKGVYTKSKAYLVTEKDTEIYFKGEHDDFDKRFNEICVDEYNKSKSKNST